MEFTIDHSEWETKQNRAPSRHVSTEKHVALDALLDNLLDLGRPRLLPSHRCVGNQITEVGDSQLTTDP